MWAFFFIPCLGVLGVLGAVLGIPALNPECASLFVVLIVTVVCPVPVGVSAVLGIDVLGAVWASAWSGRPRSGAQSMRASRFVLLLLLWFVPSLSAFPALGAALGR